MNNAIYADIKYKNDTIRLFNLHMQSFRIQLNSAKTNKSSNFLSKMNFGISKQIEQANLVKRKSIDSNKKTIICGDLNSTPYSLPYRILRKGLHDSFVRKGDGLGTTYKLFNYPLRLDYFLVDPRIQIYNHQNFDLNLSDHEPVCMVFKI